MNEDRINLKAAQKRLQANLDLHEESPSILTHELVIEAIREVADAQDRRYAKAREVRLLGWAYGMIVTQRGIWTKEIGEALTAVKEAKGHSLDRKIFEIEDLIDKELSKKYGPTGPQRVFGEATPDGIAYLKAVLADAV